MVPGASLYYLWNSSISLIWKFKKNVKKKNPKDKNKIANIILEDRRKIRARNIHLEVAVEETEVEAWRKRK